MHRLIKIILFCFSFIIILCFFSCKKLKTYEISDDLKSWCGFKPGSYWIYINDSTGSVDSTYINESTISETKGGDAEGAYYQQITLYFNSRFLDSFILTYLCSPISFYDFEDLFLISIKNTYGGTIAPLAIDPHIPYDKEIIPCHYQDVLFKMKLVDTVSFNKINYFNIIYSTEWSVSSLSEFYLSKDIGLIYVHLKNIYEDEKWSLKKYHIVF